MRKSVLEMYIDILKALAHCGPQKLTPISHKANVNCSLVKDYLGLLLRQGYVDEQIVRTQSVVYSITRQVVKVLKYFKELKQPLPLME